MEVFVAFDPADAERAAELMASWSARSPGTAFTSWVAETASDRPYIDPPGGGPRFHDAAGRPLVTDESKIRRAAGVLVLVTVHAGESDVVRAAVEAAYGLGTGVVAVQVDQDAELPRNVSSREVVTADSPAIAGLLARWCAAAREEESLSWWARLGRTLRSDRDSRR